MTNKNNEKIYNKREINDLITADCIMIKNRSGYRSEK